MRLSVSGDGLRPGTELRQYVDRRLQFALGRFGPAIERVAVRVADINGPRGGIDKYCRIVVTLRGRSGHPVAVDDRDEDLYAAVARASARIGRTLGRALERKRETRSRPSRRGPAGNGQ